MISTGGQLKCKRCGYLRNIGKDDNLKKRTEIVKRDIVIVEDYEQVITKPTTAIKCPKCSHNLAEWWLRQLRSADESEVRFFRCTACKHTWREYD